MGALAVGDQILAARDHRMVVCWCLVRCWCLAERRRYRSQREPTGQRAAALYELPAASSFRTHRFPPSKNDTTTKSRPRGREHTLASARVILQPITRSCEVRLRV